MSSDIEIVSKCYKISLKKYKFLCDIIYGYVCVTSFMDTHQNWCNVISVSIISHIFIN